MATSIVQFRVDDELKAEATEIYSKLGMDLSTALRIFLTRSVAVKGIPFSMTLADEELEENKGLSALSAMQMSAMENGVSEMTLDEINAEISAYRQEKRGNTE